LRYRFGNKYRVRLITIELVLIVPINFDRFLLEKENPMKFILAVVGMAMFLEGLPYFLFPEKTKKILAEILEQPAVNLKIIGFILLALGLLITFFSTLIITD
jgi:uncharacterized protein YjeT (DUF2065 family)